MKKRILAACLICAACLLGGCSNYIEIEKLIIVAGAAIDYDETTQMYQVTAEILDLQGSSGKDANYETIYIESEGESLVEAIADMSRMAGRQLYWDHADVFVLSQSVVSHSVEPVLDWFTSDVNARLSALVVVAGTEKASDIYQLESLGQKSVSISLERILENYQSKGHAIVSINELMNSYGIKGFATCIPMVSGEQNAGQDILVIQSYAVLKHDVLSGVYEGKDVSYLMLLLKNPLKSVISVSIPDTEATLKMQVVSHDISVRTKMEDSILHASVQMDLTLSVVGNMGDDSILKSDDGEARILEATEKTVREACSQLIDRDIESFGADILRIGQHIQRHDPKTWHRVEADWENVYAGMQYELQIRAIVDKSGKMSPINDQEEAS